MQRRRPFPAWTFDGDVPGPVLRLERGAARRIKLVNASARATSLHFMGASYVADDDGTLDTPTSVAQPGCAHVYSIAGDAPGFWPFLSHVEPRLSLVHGQYGALVVPAQGERDAEHEYVLFAGQLGFEPEGDRKEGAAASTFRMTFNGRASPQVLTIERQGDAYVKRPDVNPSARVGDLVRWRIVNVSPDDTHSFGIHGHTFCDRGGIADPAGACPNGGLVADVVAVTPLTAATIEFAEDNPGHWLYHCHVLDHVTDGMAGYYDATP